MNHTPKYRWPLNDEQLEVLNLLYKFRFGSSDLIAHYFGKKNGAFVYKRLKILQEQGFIGKRFDESYRIKGMPAAYYLLPDGARKLNESRKAASKSEIGIDRLYKETRVTDSFVQHCLDAFDIYLTLKAHYGDTLHFFTKSQLANEYDYFSEFAPGAYIRVVTKRTEKDYFLEYLQSSKPFFAITKRIKEYIEYAESGEWEAGTDSEFPEILLVCDKPGLQNRLLKKSASILADADDDLKLFVTVKDSDTWFDLVEPKTALTSSPI